MKYFLSLVLAALISGMRADTNDALLFHLSCDHGLNAEVHQGKGTPNFAGSISEIADGADGKAFRCGEGQLLAYQAPGNIYAQRGTLSFWWRSGIELTPTEFPIFRVSYADHSSWDMVWLRIDYNGQGFDAFVTDNGLARVRVSYKCKEGIDAQHWYHLALTWDENRGIRFYVDGQLVGEKRDCVVLNTGLDQFGPHSRIISPYQVQTAYNCIRGGDIDELRIYSQPLAASDIKALSQCQSPQVLADASLLNDDVAWMAWQHYYGFDGDVPMIEEHDITIRKVAIHDAYDLKRWYWKGCDGIRETTWPGVYNRSSLPGRFDYIQLPDWDCYSLSGQQVRFTLADEPWNHLEVTGSAHGSFSVNDDKCVNSGSFLVGGKQIARRADKTFHSIHHLDEVQQGQTLVFDNDVQEMPIQELDAYYIHQGVAPEGIVRLNYQLGDFTTFLHPALMELQQYVVGRHQPNERQMLLAMPVTKGSRSTPPAIRVEESTSATTTENMPLVHVVIPNDMRDINANIPLVLDDKTPETGDTGLAWTARSLPYSWRYMQGGLDGIRLELPSLPEGVCLNIQVKDPIWPLRNMMDVTVRVKGDEPHVLWLDMRDRILPNDRPLYLTIAASDKAFSADLLKGMQLQLVFKSCDEAKIEHIADRMVQIIDNHGMIVEEATSTRRMSKYVQIERDMEDLLRVDPTHDLARKYWYCYNPEQVKPAFTPAPIAKGVPRWAALQLQLLSKYRDLVEWYIDNRQIENGEFGGGLSDDTDLGNVFPGLIHSGAIAAKASSSLELMLQAIYDQHLLKGGISTLMTDGLHTYEEGTNTIVQVNTARPGNPLQTERMMEAARSERDWVLGHNAEGHLHFRSDYFSATRIADQGLWTWSTPREFLHLGPALMMGQQYGNMEARRYIIEFAESMLAHSRQRDDGHVDMPVEINFQTDSVRRWGTFFSMVVLDYCYRWTKDPRYLAPLLDASSYTYLTSRIDTASMADRYAEIIQQMDWRDFIMKQGSVWIDRIYFSVDDIQRSRLGGIALTRGNYFVPSNPVRWQFASDEEAEQLAIFIPEAKEDCFDIHFFNTSSHAISVEMIGNVVRRGTWDLTVAGTASQVRFGQDKSVSLTIPAGVEYSVSMHLLQEAEDNTGLCDLAIGHEDIVRRGNKLEVVVHNLGAQASLPTRLVVIGEQDGRVVTADVPVIPAPADLLPSTAKLLLKLPRSIQQFQVIIDPDNEQEECYKSNNSVRIE